MFDKVINVRLFKDEMVEKVSDRESRTEYRAVFARRRKEAWQGWKKMQGVRLYLRARREQGGRVCLNISELLLIPQCSVVFGGIISALSEQVELNDLSSMFCLFIFNTILCCYLRQGIIDEQN